jgi:hypothetical protein
MLSWRGAAATENYRLDPSPERAAHVNKPLTVFFFIEILGNPELYYN